MKSTVDFTSTQTQLVCEVVTSNKSYNLRATKTQSTSTKSTKCVMMDYGFELLMLCVMVIRL